MSAECNLAAIFPPNEDQTWHKTIPWQPIPVHNIPQDLDILLLATKPCPAYDYYYSQLLKSETFRTLETKFKSLFEYLTKWSGDIINIDLWTLVDLYDTLLVQKFNNKT